MQGRTSQGPARFDLEWKGLRRSFVRPPIHETCRHFGMKTSPWSAARWEESLPGRFMIHSKTIGSVFHVDPSGGEHRGLSKKYHFGRNIGWSKDPNAWSILRKAEKTSQLAMAPWMVDHRHPASISKRQLLIKAVDSASTLKYPLFKNVCRCSIAAGSSDEWQTISKDCAYSVAVRASS